jgi:biopolymer transport protein ExbD
MGLRRAKSTSGRVKPHFRIPDSLLSRKTESKKVTDEAVDEGMKSMFGCSLAAVMGSMLMLGLCTQGMSVTGPGYSNANPRLELPTISNWKSFHRHRQIHLSLNRHQQWIFEDGEVVRGELGNSLARRAATVEALGYRPSIRVRIAANEPARNFLHLHKAATAAGIEEFSIACFRAEVP